MMFSFGQSRGWLFYSFLGKLLLRYLKVCLHFYLLPFAKRECWVAIKFLRAAIHYLIWLICCSSTIGTIIFTTYEESLSATAHCCFFGGVYCHSGETDFTQRRAVGVVSYIPYRYGVGGLDVFQKTTSSGSGERPVEDCRCGSHYCPALGYVLWKCKIRQRICGIGLF